MNRLNLKTLRILLSILLFTGLIIFITNKSDLIEILGHTKWYYLMAIGFTYFLNYFFVGNIYHYPLKKLNIHLHFHQWFGLTNLTSLLNLILPAKGGTAFRWFYMREFYELPTSTFFSINLFGTAIGMITIGYIGLILNLLLPGLRHTLILSMNSMFWFLLISGISIFLGLSRFHSKRIKIFNKVPEEIKGAKVFLAIVLSFAIIVILYPIRTYLSFKSLGIELSAQQGMEISLISLILSVVPILPGNLGIKEIAFAYLAKRYGISAEIAILSSLIDRFGLYLFIMPTGIAAYFSVFLKSQKKSSTQAIS